MSARHRFYLRGGPAICPKGGPFGSGFRFHRISDDDAARILADVEVAFDLIDAIDRTDEPAGDIDKAWDGLRYLLGAAGVGVDLLRDDEPSRDEACTTVWSAEEVAAAALSLAATLGCQ
ncbi:DUF1877 family protein [Nocardia sp. NPDC055053]